MNKTEEQIAFYMEIGQALTHFAHVEQALFNAARAGFHEDLARKALGVGFFTIEGARARREFAEAVVTRILLGNNAAHFKGEWIDLVARAQSAAKLRHKLAHWVVRVYPEAAPGRRYALEDFIQPKKRKIKTRVPLPRPGALCLRDIVKIRLEFLALMCAFENFVARVAGSKEPYPKSAEQPNNLPQIGQLRRQMLEGLARLLRPSDEKSPDQKV